MTSDAGRRDLAHLFHPYTHLARHQTEGPLVVTRGEGVRVFDEDGRGYIEGMAGLWCAALGFSEPRLAAAAARQLETLGFYHLFGSKSHPAAIDLAERLAALAPRPAGKEPLTRVLFANSGSEANDTALKLIRYYNNAIGRPQKKKIISRRRAYHGVTLATASLTGLPGNHRDFDLPLPGILHADCPHHYREARPGESEQAFSARLADSLDALIRAEGPETVAAFFAEPVMGAGGVVVPPAGYFDAETENRLASFRRRAGVERRPALSAELPDRSLRQDIAAGVAATAISTPSRRCCADTTCCWWPTK